MSLVMFCQTPDGIVIGGDTRKGITSKYQNADSSDYKTVVQTYSDTSHKIMKYKGVLIGTLGNACVYNSRYDAIYLAKDVLKEHNSRDSIEHLPEKILAVYNEVGKKQLADLAGRKYPKSVLENWNTTYLICGRQKVRGVFLPVTYMVRTKEQTIDMIGRPGESVIGAYGDTYIFEAVKNRIVKNLLTLEDAEILVRDVIETTIRLNKYSNDPIVGGICEINTVKLY